MRHLQTTKMLRKGKTSMKRPAQEQSQFTMTKAMVLASTDYKQRSGISTAAACFAMDGHSVDLSEELVEQKPSIVRSDEWDTSLKTPPKTQANPGTIRVCWQCPEASKAMGGRSGLLARLLADLD